MSLRVACPRCRRHIRLGVQVNPVNPSAPSSAQVNGNIIMTDEYCLFQSYDAHSAVPNSLIYTRSEVPLAVLAVTQNFTSIQKLAKRKFSIPGKF